MKKILTALCGKTPQIVTEALYALHEQGRFPSRVVILTTEEGRELCRTQLLHPEHGSIARLLADIGLSPDSLSVTEADILTPRRRVADIVTEEDSRAFFELCLETVFSLARDHGTELLFSIAGGRKTMSAALALAAQCYARPQDSMFHVLVPPELESNPEFFYPAPPFAEARVTLTPIPFFRMRGQLQPQLLHSPASLEELSQVCMPQKPLEVELDFVHRSLTCEGRSLALPPALFAVYAFFALEKAACPDAAELCPHGCRACAHAWADIEPRLGEMLNLYQQVETKALARGTSGILNLSAENFRSSLAKLRKLLVQTFGEHIGMRLSIVSERRGGAASYALRIPRGQMRIVPQRCER